ALLLERLGLGGVAALVGEADLDAAGEEGELAQAPAHAGVVEALDVLEHRHVGAAGDAGAGLLLGAGPHDVERLHDLAVGAADAVVLAVQPHLGHEVGGQRVHHRAAHAVQAARDLVGPGVELAARVELGEDDLDGGAPLALHGVDGDAAAVVGDAGGAVGVEGDLDGVGVAGQRLVDGVVDDLGEELVVAVDAGAALHVHGGALAHALEAAQHLDVLGGVSAGRLVRVQRNLRVRRRG